MIEQEFYTDGFEQMLKEKADQLSMYPSRRVWHSIYNNLHPGRRWPSLAMAIFLITSLMLIGYLNTGDNSMNSQTNNNNNFSKTSDEISNTQNNNTKKQSSTFSRTKQQPASENVNVFSDVITNETDLYNYTIVRNNRPSHFYTSSATNQAVDKQTTETGNNVIIQSMDTYIKSNQIFTDVAETNRKQKITGLKNTAVNTAPAPGMLNTEEEIITAKAPGKSSLANPFEVNDKTTASDKMAENDKKGTTKINAVDAKNTAATEQKAWIENFALQNKPTDRKNLKSSLAYQFYLTPAVNYRKLSTNTKGSATPFANSDINHSISQKPGFGFEAGAGITYSFAKNLRLKTGLQFNYTNYNIDADQTNHPILTTILLNDPNTGYSYIAARTSTTSNAYNTTALQPITLHNTTYQISIPIGIAYKLSSQNNVDWFAGASVQPTYVFGGNAHLISSDLKSYVSDPSTIRTWNLNLGFETYMNFKLGDYNFQVGPQVRYQVYSTYRKTVALIEKPYAVGLKLGLTKGF